MKKKDTYILISLCCSLFVLLGLVYLSLDTKTIETMKDVVYAEIACVD